MPAGAVRQNRNQMNFYFAGRKILLLVLTFCTCGTGVIRCQEFVFNHLNESNGLASKFVKAVWQDPKGFLWIGTDNGLQRYDGKNFFSPHAVKGTNLPFAPVSQIMNDNKGRIWLRFGSTVGIYDPSTFRWQQATINHKTDNPGGEPPVLKLDVNGSMYLLLKTQSIIYFDETSFSFDAAHNPYALPKNWTIYASYDDTIKKRTWLSNGMGLGCYDWTTKQLWTSGNNPQNLLLLKDSSRLYVKNITIDSKRRHWISHVVNGAAKFLCYGETTNSFLKDTAGMSRAQERGFYDLYNVNVFSDGITIASGLNMFQVQVNNRFENFEDHTPQGSVKYEKISQVFGDREGIIWVACDNGLYSLTPASRRNKRLFIPEGSNQILNAISQLNDGKILVGKYGRGIDLYDEQFNLLKPDFIRSADPDQRYRNIWSLASHPATNTVWIGCEFGRLAVYDYASGRLDHYRPAAFAGSTIARMIVDTAGTIWFAIAGGDIVQWKPGNGMHDSSFRLVNNVGSSVAEMGFHSDGNLYACTRGSGVWVLNGKTGKTEYKLGSREQLKISSDMVGDVGRVNDSTLCFVADGLVVMNTKTRKLKTIYQQSNELLGEMILGIPDRYGDYWFVSTNGLHRYSSGSNYIRRYNESDGLGSLAGGLAVVDRARLRNGKILMVGAGTAIMFDPANYRSGQKPGDVLISNISIGNDYQPLDSILSLKKVDLSRDQNSITISFSIPEFAGPTRYFYNYKLENADKDWVTAGVINEARYSGLAPGTYTFMVRAQNETGEVSANTTTVRFVIHPPFWRTWWFISLMIALIALIAWQVHRLRLEQVLKVERVRTRLARDLHDDMGSTLSSINLLSTVAINKIGKSDDDVHAHLQKIGQSSGRVMEAMDDIVWSINPANDNMIKITARMREFLGNTLEAKEIRYSFEITEEVKGINFNMEQRRDLFLIFKEIINNVIKYSEASTVSINMTTEKKLFKMIITDNGKGFDPDAPLKETRGNGTRNMKARAEAIGGKLFIKSAIGKGTSVELMIAVH